MKILVAEDDPKSRKLPDGLAALSRVKQLEGLIHVAPVLAQRRRNPAAP